MICLIVVACLAFVGSALGQCSSYSQQDNCTSSLGNSLGNHLGNQQLICGDLSTFENCVMNISCLAFETRYEFIGQARDVVANLNVSCPINFPLPSTTRQTATNSPWQTTHPGCASNSELDTCSITFSLDAYSHLNNPTLVCEDLANLESCVARISCLTTERKNELYAQASRVVQDMKIACPTNIPWLTTREYADCYSLEELDTCTQDLSDGINAHYPNSGLVCSDVAVFSDCIWRISCLKIAERYQLILDAKASVNGFNIYCDSIGPDDGGNMSGANLTANKSIFSHLLALGIMVLLFLKYN